LQHALNYKVPVASVYHPVKDDLVDRKLADYINNAPS